MPAIFAAQTPTTNDTGAITLGFQNAPSVLYDRTMVGNTTYTISTAGTTGGETMSITLRGPYVWIFQSSVNINWAGGIAPTAECSVSVFDRIKFEVLQDGSLLGTVQALGAYVPPVAPTHYLNVAGAAKNATAPATSANDGEDSFLSIMVWLGLAAPYVSGTQQDLVTRWDRVTNGGATNSEYGFYIIPTGQLFLQIYDGSGNYQQFETTADISNSLLNAAGVWLRVDCNAGTAAAKGLAAGTVVFYTSPGGPTPGWTQLGSVVSGIQSGLNHKGSSSVPIFFGSNGDAGYTAKFYEVIIENSTNILANPNFQAQPTTASGGTFTDTAPTPNTITLNTNIV